MKIAVISNEKGVGRRLVNDNLIEVLEGSTSFECVDYDNNETSIDESEYCVLVAGSSKDSLDALKDLIQSVEVKEKAYGVVLNKSRVDHDKVKKYCQEQQIKILEEIPFDEEVSKFSDAGKVISRENEDYRMKFLNILNNVYIHMANMIFKLKTEGADGCGGH